MWDKSETHCVSLNRTPPSNLVSDLRQMSGSAAWTPAPRRSPPPAAGGCAHLLRGRDERAAGSLAVNPTVLRAALGAGRLRTGTRKAREGAVPLCPGLQEAGLHLFRKALPQVGDGRRDDGEHHLLGGDNPVPDQEVHRLLVEVEVPGTETVDLRLEAGGPRPLREPVPQDAAALWCPGAWPSQSAWPRCSESRSQRGGRGSPPWGPSPCLPAVPKSLSPKARRRGASPAQRHSPRVCGQARRLADSGPDSQAQRWSEPPSIGPIPPAATVAAMGLSLRKGREWQWGV